MHYVYGGLIGILVGGALSYFYAQSVIGEYEKAVSTVGYYFQKVEGVIQAIRRGL